MRKHVAPLCLILLGAGASPVRAQEEMSAAEMMRQAAAEDAERAPQAAEPDRMVDADDDSPASFGAELDSLAERVHVSAYGDAEVYLDGDTFTFDQVHANPIIGAPLGRGFYGELEIEFEHGGEEKFLEYAYVDWNDLEAFTVRVGKFLIPIGFFNENLHPSFRNRLVSRPLMARRIIPSTWSDTGAQIRGRVRFGRTRLSYNLFGVNGLQEKVGGEGGAIRDMRQHERDLDDKGKALGGRLGLAHHFGVDLARLGISAYRGAISRDGKRALRLGAVDFNLRVRAVTLEAEGAAADLDVPAGGSERRFGLYAQLTWEIDRRWSTSARYDLVDEPDLDGREQRASAGVLCAFNTHVRWFFEASGRRVAGGNHPSARSMVAFSF